MNFPGHTETDSRNSQYAIISSTARNTSEQPAEQTVTNLQYIRVLMSPHESSWVLHLGCSSMCFTALVRLIDGQMLRRVLCFFLLPSCSGARQRSQLQSRSLCNGWDCQIKRHPFPQLPFPNTRLDIFFEKWSCHSNGSEGKYQRITLGSLYSFWQAKAPKPLQLKQLRTLYNNYKKYTQIFQVLETASYLAS